MTTTPLGFKKPDGNELARNGENVIADNAQTAQDVIAPAIATLTAHGAALAALNAAAFGSGAIPLIEDPADPGFYILSS